MIYFARRRIIFRIHKNNHFGFSHQFGVFWQQLVRFQNSHIGLAQSDRKIFRDMPAETIVRTQRVADAN